MKIIEKNKDKRKKEQRSSVKYRKTNIKDRKQSKNEKEVN